MPLGWLSVRAVKPRFRMWIQSEPEDCAILTKMFCCLFYAWLYKKQLQQSEFVFADWRCCDKSLVTQNNGIHFFGGGGLNIITCVSPYCARHNMCYDTWLNVLNFIVMLLSPQTDHLGRVYPFSNWDAGLHLHPQLGSPVGGVRYSWSFRVGNH